MVHSVLHKQKQKQKQKHKEGEGESRFAPAPEELELLEYAEAMERAEFVEETLASKLGRKIRAGSDSPTRFAPPTLEAVKLQGAKIGLPDDQCIRFHAYYESNGWKVGKNSMKSWPAAMVNWRGGWQAGLGSHGPPGRNGYQRLPEKTLEEKIAEENLARARSIR